MRASRTSARGMEYKYTLKEEQPYRDLLVSPKDKSQRRAV